MTELKDKLPRAADILHEQYKNHIKGFDSIYPDRFPVAYNSIAIDAMHEYCKQLTEKANAKIAELEKRYNDLSGALRFKYGEWENLKAENEQLEKRLAEAEKERDEFAKEFLQWYWWLPSEKRIGKRTQELLEQFKQQKK